jgi:hypothetical protein
LTFNIIGVVQQLQANVGGGVLVVSQTVVSL